MLKEIFKVKIKLPVIGTAFLWELPLILIYIVLTVVGAGLSLEIAPMLDGVFMTGSGGGGQFFTLIFFGPLLLFSGILTLVGAGASVSLLRKIFMRSSSAGNSLNG